jgi:hypothetical protein
VLDHAMERRIRPIEPAMPGMNRANCSEPKSSGLTRSGAKMFSLRSATNVIAAVALIGAAFGEANGQTAANHGPSAPEIAKAIASVINAKTVKTPGQPIAFESATSHDNVVELRYVVSDPAGFARLKANLDQARSIKAAYYCKDTRLAYLNRGVVMHEVMATSTHSDQIDFTFDKSSCASVSKASVADSKTLAALAPN